MALTLSQGLFCFPCPAWEGTQETREEHGQDSWPKLAKGIFYTMECHAQYTNWWKLARSHCSLVGDKLVINQWVMSMVLCITCFPWASFSLLLLLFLLLFLNFDPIAELLLLLLLLHYYYFASIIKLFFSPTMSFPFFPILCEWANDYLVLSQLLKLNLDTWDSEFPNTSATICRTAPILASTLTTRIKNKGKKSILKF